MTGPRLSRRSLLRTTGLAAGAAAALGTELWTPASATDHIRPLLTSYVEVNSYSIGNVAKYDLASGRPAFDIGLIFAANINYDGQQAYLYNNPQVQATLDAADAVIRPAQARGTKILLSVLGNHGGAGFANFPDYAAADAFAAQVADTVDTYGLDGVDLDDEWADYGANGTGAPNEFSFVYLTQALRRRMPDKIISLYYIGPSIEHLSYDGVRVGDQIDYAWNPYYGAWLIPDVPGLADAQLGAAAVNLTATPASTAASLAQRTFGHGYGVYTTYNLTDADTSAYLSTITRRLYGEPTVYTG